MAALTIVAVLGIWCVVSVALGTALGTVFRRADHLTPALIPVHRRRFTRAS